MTSDASFMPSDEEESNNTEDGDVLYSPESTKIDQNITNHQ